MRFADKVVLLMSDNPLHYERLEAECVYSEHEHAGMRCDRATQQRFANQDQSNAQADRGAVNDNLKNYDRKLTDYMNFGDKTYGAAGDYMKTMNTLGNTAAKAGADNIAGSLALNKMRTGENSASYAGTVAEAQRSGERNLTDFLANANANRMDKLNNVRQFGVTASSLPAEIQSRMYGTDVGGANENAKSADWEDQLLDRTISAGAQVGAAFA